MTEKIKYATLILLFIAVSAKLRAQFIPGVSYYGVNNYIEYIAGDMPVIFVAPHAGSLEPPFLPDIYTRGPDNGTMELAVFMADSLHFKAGGCRPHVIINHLRPSKLNPVFMDSIQASGTHPISLQAFNDFHNFIQIAHNRVTTDWGKGHYFELHGNGTAEQWNMVGLGVSKTYLNLPDSLIAGRVNYSTVKNLCTAGGASFLELIKGPTSLGGMLDSLGWKSTTSPAHPAPPDSVTFFYAGQNTWEYGSFLSGTIDATHLESYWEFMVLPLNRSPFSNDLADAILSFMNIHYGFSFNCTTPINPGAQPFREKIKLYPNPCKPGDKVRINSHKSIRKAEIFNSSGFLCKSIYSCEHLDTQKLIPGLYFIKLILDPGITELQILIVE